MKKIISLFKRNYEGNRLVYNEVVPGAEWVVAGEGIATIKLDGMACMVRDGKFFKRYDAKKGRQPPQGFDPAQEPDPITGHWPGWVLVGEGPEDRWLREARDNTPEAFEGPAECTYEAVGPKIHGNPYGLTKHELWRHGCIVVAAPRTFEALQSWFALNLVEGLVWHHPDGQMVKIKRRDFGLPWP